MMPPMVAPVLSLPPTTTHCSPSLPTVSEDSGATMQPNDGPPRSSLIGRAPDGSDTPPSTGGIRGDTGCVVPDTLDAPGIDDTPTVPHMLDGPDNSDNIPDTLDIPDTIDLPSIRQPLLHQ